MNYPNIIDSNYLPKNLNQFTFWVEECDYYGLFTIVGDLVIPVRQLKYRQFKTDEEANHFATLAMKDHYIAKKMRMCRIALLNPYANEYESEVIKLPLYHKVGHLFKKDLTVKIHSSKIPTRNTLEWSHHALDTFTNKLQQQEVLTFFDTNTYDGICSYFPTTRKNIKFLLEGTFDMITPEEFKDVLTCNERLPCYDYVRHIEETSFEIFHEETNVLDSGTTKNGNQIGETNDYYIYTIFKAHTITKRKTVIAVILFKKSEIKLYQNRVLPLTLPPNGVAQVLGNAGIMKKEFKTLFHVKDVVITQIDKS